VILDLVILFQNRHQRGSKTKYRAENNITHVGSGGNQTVLSSSCDPWSLLSFSRTNIKEVVVRTNADTAIHCRSEVNRRFLSSLCNPWPYCPFPEQISKRLQDQNAEQKDTAISTRSEVSIRTYNRSDPTPKSRRLFVQKQAWKRLQKPECRVEKTAAKPASDRK
jgi:hypothetical protein